MLAPIDRFLIGSLISVAAITYYATPYEVVTKLLLIPNALTGVLFPIFSSSQSNDTHFSKRVFYKGVKFIFLILYPVVLVIVTFAYEGMELWLGNKFAIHSSLILQLLAIGVLLNSITYIPFNYLQGIGKPKIPALIYSAELPIYVVIMLVAVKKWGINGAAYIWVLRVIVDSLLMFLIANKFLVQNFTSKLFIYNLLLLTSLLIIPFFLIIIWVKCIFIFIALSILSFLTWKYFLDDEEKEMIFLRLKMIIPLQLKS
jgi:O-antigen/teichoic acid export membrane protein